MDCCAVDSDVVEEDEAGVMPGTGGGTGGADGGGAVDSDVVVVVGGSC